MKKLILISIAIVSGLINTNAQNSFELTNNSAGGIITNNSIITETVTAGLQSHVYVQMKNIGSTTKTYAMRRTDVVLNSGAEAYFCWGGQCFPSSTTVTPVANYLTLNAGASDTPQSLYYDENVAQGYSEIKYEVYDVNNMSDMLTFTFKFNSLTSVKENNSLLSFVSDIYPNPSVNKAQIIVNSKINTSEASVSITNALGSIVSTNTVELSAGKNNIQLNSENLSSGIYFTTITLGNARVVRKFTINK